MTNITHLVAQELENQLILTWEKEGTYHSGISFEWRNILIDLEVDVRYLGNSREDTIKININGKRFRFGLGRIPGGGGPIGKPPSIETKLNFLSIILRDNKIILKDNLKDGNKLQFKEKFPFRVISIPSSFNFEKVDFRDEQ